MPADTTIQKPRHKVSILFSRALRPLRAPPASVIRAYTHATHTQQRDTPKQLAHKFYNFQELL